MSKVDYKELRSAVVVMTNEVDATREFEISANVSVQGGYSVGAIDNGVVRQKGATEGNIATFSAWSSTNKSVNYSGECDECMVLLAINTFIADCKEKVANGGIVTSIA